MNDQATVEHLAQLAKPRLMDLLKLKVEHLYDPIPGTANSAPGLKRLTTTQPYKDIARFLADEKVIGYIVNPGVLPIAKAISLDIRGRHRLITRKLESPQGDRRAMAHLDGLGVRIMMYFDPTADETQIVWDCLYSVS